jgi:hypothetical protein
MKTKLQAVFAFLLLALLAFAAYRWVHDAPRRESLASLRRLDEALRSGNRAELLKLLVIPAAIQNRTAPEQSEFLARALHDEISPPGLTALEKDGEYGPLKELFPAEAGSWASQAGVNPDDCVAFKLKRNGLCAEVVLLKPLARNTAPRQNEAPAGHLPGPKQGYRIVRINNVKQMAGLGPLTARQDQ